MTDRQAKVLTFQRVIGPKDRRPVLNSVVLVSVINHAHMTCRGDYCHTDDGGVVMMCPTCFAESRIPREKIEHDDPITVNARVVFVCGHEFDIYHGRAWKA
jgi:hypothetical protein